MSKTYQVILSGRVLLSFRADFAQASSPLMIEVRSGSFDSTPYQVADAGHRPAEAARMLNGWCRSEGGEAWAPGTTGLRLRVVRDRAAR